MRSRAEPILATTAVKLAAIAICMVFLPINAMGQQGPEQPVNAAHNNTTVQDQSQRLYSLSIDDTQIKDVIESLAKQANFSLVLSEDINARISLRLKEVSWQTALDAALQAGGYTAVEKDGVLFVFEKEKKLYTETFRLSFANAEKTEKTISKLISANGRVGVDARLNAIVVSETEANLEQIRRSITTLDVEAPQVMIEALIINVKLTDELKMGIDWTKLGTLNNYFSQDLSITGSTNPFGQINFSKVAGNWTLAGLLDFIQTHSDVKVLANPKVLVLNNHTATIEAVEEVPYRKLSETSAGGMIGTTSFKEAGIKLQVTPQVTQDGQIIIHVKPEQSAQIGTFTIENSETPVIETRKAETTLRVKDGQTIIIGGLRKQQPTVEESKIPILGDIPLIGLLFRKVVTKQIESELAVFITPHIYTDGKLSDDELKLIEQSWKNESLLEAGNPLRSPGSND